MEDKRILIAYASNSGSTEEVANVVAEEFRRFAAQVDARRIDEQLTLAGYDALVVGAPMILGWHRAALGFVRRNREALRRVPSAYFIVGMSLTASEAAPGTPPLALDPDLVKPPRRADRLSLRERYTSVPHYIGPVLKAAAGAKPVSLAVFGGRMDLYRLNWLQMLFVLLVVQAQPTDLRNWPFIRSWAAQIAPRLLARDLGDGPIGRA
jgi:menaquinone-dependent protoporphyrinogen IX oxidase